MKNIQLLLQMLVLAAFVTSCTNVEPGSTQESEPVETEVHFLQQKSTNGLQMEALMEGRLVLEEGCLRIQSSNEGYTAIWPFEFSFSVQSSTVNILNGEGQVVAQVGDHIRVSGGGGSLNMSQKEFTEYYLGSYQCSEPYWIVGYEVAVITP